MHFAIRPYAETDRRTVIDALTALQEHERAMHDTRRPGAGATEVYLDNLLEDLVAQSGAIFIAEADGKFAGLVTGLIETYEIVLETRDSSIYGYCSDIYVAPEFRGSGLAQMLLDVMERHLAAQAPITRFRISVLAVNRIACRAYERAGFVPYELMYERLVRRDRS
jgi:ribosomal protein S18 acetylase RimI-like enzyme